MFVSLTVKKKLGGSEDTNQIAKGTQKILKTIFFLRAIVSFTPYTPSSSNHPSRPHH